MVLLNIGGKVT